MAYQCAPNYFTYHGHLWAAVRPVPANRSGFVAWSHVAPNGREAVLAGEIVGCKGDILSVMAAHGTLFDVPVRVAKAAYRPDARQYARHLIAQDGPWVAVRESAMIALMDAFDVSSGKALGIVCAARGRKAA